MGQRFQSVFILPKVYMNEGNPNNRSEKVLVFHNQWLFGKIAININLDIIKRLKEAIETKDKCGSFAKTNQDFINHYLEESVKKAIKWVSVQELHNETYFHEPEELDYSKEDKKPKGKRTSLKELLNFQDNNNGFFICKIDDNLKISYTFISGFEDEDTIKQKTPKEYLNLFYKNEDLKKQKVFGYMEKQIKSFKEFEEIDSSWLKDIIKYLNETKPSWAN